MTDLPLDNRRAIVRIFAYDALRALSSLARLGEGDLIEVLTFTGIWTLNSHHLIGEERYVELRDIPPDALRRPVSLDELLRLLSMPEDIVRAYVDRLIAKDMVERSPGGGLVVPSAVFSQPAMLDATNEIYGWAVALVTDMRSAGFRFGDDDELDLRGPASS